MEKFLNILESLRPQQDNFHEEKMWYISTKISLWDFFGIPEAIYRDFSVPEKSKMFREYYAKLSDNIMGRQVKFFFSGLIVCFWTWSDIFFSLF